MESKTTPVAPSTLRQIRRTKDEFKNLLLRNLLRTNKRILRNLDISNVVLF